MAASAPIGANEYNYQQRRLMLRSAHPNAQVNTSTMESMKKLRFKKMRSTIGPSSQSLLYSKPEIKAPRRQTIRN